MRRVVITGLGMVSPVGCGVEASWQALLAGANGARRIEEFEVADLTCQIGCFIPRGAKADGKFNPDDWMEPKEQRKVDDFIIYAMAAAEQAHRRFRLQGRHGREAGARRRAHRLRHRRPVGHRRDLDPAEGEGPAPRQPVLHSRAVSSISPRATSRSSIKLKGPNHAVVTACSTGAHAIGDAARLVALGDADVMVAGGTESPICRIAVAGFAACRALSTGFNDRPDGGLAPLRQGPRRLRDGRGRRRRRARGAGARQGARRQDLRRGHRLRHVGRRLPHHRARPRTATAPTAACARR